MAKNPVPNILRVRGLIVEDAQGHERLLLGAPIPQTKGRKRQDSATGVVFLGPTGNDRITIGDEPDPMVNGKIYHRFNKGIGVIISDPDGTERGTYGVLDNGVALATLDWAKTGEGFVAAVSKQSASAGIWHKNRFGVEQEAISMGAENGQVYIKITDSTGVPRSNWSLNGVSSPKLLLYDQRGKEIKDIIKK